MSLLLCNNLLQQSRRLLLSRQRSVCSLVPHNRNYYLSQYPCGGSSSSSSRSFSSSLHHHHQDKTTNKEEEEEEVVLQRSPPNPGLASVIAQGIQSLEETAADVEAKTRHLVGNLTESSKQKQKVPTHRQLAEAERIFQVATECLDDLCSTTTMQQQQQQQQQLTGLQLKGEPIVILNVQVNRDVKLAKIYWTLPYSVLLDPNVTQRVYQKLVQVIHNQLLQRSGGGAKLLSREVGNRLRFYYPPRIRLVPATTEMIQQAILELHE